MERTHALPVQTQILAEALRDAQFHAARGKLTDRPGVVLQIARREALVRRIEKGEYAFALAQAGDFAPLVAGRVDARRVVGAGVQQDHVARCGVGFERVDHASEVERARGCVEVRILADLDGVGAAAAVRRPGGDEVPDQMVVGPCRGGDPDLSRFRRLVLLLLLLLFLLGVVMGRQCGQVV